MVLAILLLAAGLFISLAGLKLFRILLPIIGLVGGTMAGFIGFQSVFGKGVISTSVAIFVAIALGLLLAILSYFFFRFALWLYAAILAAEVFGYLGLVLGLGGHGFLLFLLGLAGFIVGAKLASSTYFSTSFVIALTSFTGVAFILAGVFVISGHVSVDTLNQTGIIRTVANVVGQSFLWMLVWLGGSLVAIQSQKRTLLIEVLGDAYAYQPSPSKK